MITRKTPERRIEMMRLADLIERWHPANPKGHNIPGLIESYERWGYTIPCLLCERADKLASGHGRTEALETMRSAGSEPPAGIEVDGEDWLVPTVRGWSSVDDVELLAYVVADNRQTELGGWNDTLLTDILRQNDEARRSFKGIGYSRDDLMLLLDKLKPKEDGAADPAQTARYVLPENPTTQRGDVWLIGPHRFMCGDCRDAGDVATLMAGERIHLAFTSPPYADRRKYDESSEFRPVHPDKYVEWFAPVAERVAEHLAEDGSWFVNIKPGAEDLDTHLYVHDLVAAHVREWGWHFATEFCWERSGVPKQIAARFKNQFEPVYQFARGKWKIRPDNVAFASENAIRHAGRNDDGTDWSKIQGQGRPFFLPEQQIKKRRNGYTGPMDAVQGTSVSVGESVGLGWAFPGNRLPTFSGTHEATGHSAAFPVGLPAWFVRAYTDVSDNVYDPFCGSGSTVIAAHNEKRTGYGMEISPRYCDVALARMQRVMGVMPTRNGEAVDFSELAVLVDEAGDEAEAADPDPEAATA